MKTFDVNLRSSSVTFIQYGLLRQMVNRVFHAVIYCTFRYQVLHKQKTGNVCSMFL